MMFPPPNYWYSVVNVMQIASLEAYFLGKGWCVQYLVISPTVSVKWLIYFSHLFCRKSHAQYTGRYVTLNMEYGFKKMVTFSFFIEPISIVYVCIWIHQWVYFYLLYMLVVSRHWLVHVYICVHCVGKEKTNITIMSVRSKESSNYLLV